MSNVSTKEDMLIGPCLSPAFQIVGATCGGAGRDAISFFPKRMAFPIAAQCSATGTVVAPSCQVLLFPYRPPGPCAAGKPHFGFQQCVLPDILDLSWLYPESASPLSADIGPIIHERHRFSTAEARQATSLLQAECLQLVITEVFGLKVTSHSSTSFYMHIGPLANGIGSEQCMHAPSLPATRHCPE